MPAIDLIDFAADIYYAAKRTEDPDAPLVPGDHCRFCPGAGTCPAIHKKALALAKTEFTPALSYDPVKLSETLNMLPAMEAWIKSVREFAYREADHGRVPPGFKLVAKRATRKWKLHEDEIASALFNANVPLDLVFEKKLLSPAQIEKFLSKDQKKVLQSLVSAESSGSTLAPETDKRPALTATNEFTVIDVETVTTDKKGF